MPRTKATASSAPTRLPDGRAAEARGGRARRPGNAAVGRLLTAGARVGRPDDAAEGAADRHGTAAAHGRRVGGPRVGLAGAPRLGGGRALPGHVVRSFAPHFRVDLRGVRLHTGPAVDDAARSMGAEAFTYGRDVFVRGDKYDPHTRSGKALLRHELAHVDADRGRGRIIRRKMGLPTASEAKEAGGGSGFGKIGKGEWGTYRGLLDAFRAASDTDTATQIDLLRKLTVSSGKMLASDYKASKKAFVREQVPKIKKLYYEVALKGDVHDTIAREAREAAPELDRLVGEGIESRTKRMRETLGSSSPHPSAPTREALLDRLARAKLTMNFAPATLKYWIDDPDIKQFWQVRSDEGPDGLRRGPKYAKKRDRAEVMMGYGSMFDASGAVDEALRPHRPISCGLNVFDNPEGAAVGYGRWHFRLEDDVKARATYLSGDSIDEVRTRLVDWKDDRSLHIGTHAHLSGVLASNGYVFDALFMEATGLSDLGTRRQGTKMFEGDMASVREAIDDDKYIEVQVHGGLSVDDVETLVVDVPEDRSRRTTKQQIADGAWADAWKAKYKSKAPIRWA